MTHNKEIHVRAFLTNFEIACEAGILALVADLAWLTHDVLHNGLSLWYVTVFIGLCGGLGLTVFALFRHHNYYTHRIYKRFYAPKQSKPYIIG